MARLRSNRARCAAWLAVLAFIPAKAVILDPPVLHCVSAGPGGAAVLTWSIPPDPGGDCLHYEVWHATSAAGPFALLTTVGCSTSTYTHLAAGSDMGPRFYYLTTVSTSPPPNTSVPSDTVATLFLAVQQSVPLGSAVLIWQAPAPSATTTPQLVIEMEYPPGTWAAIATVPFAPNFHQHIIDICAAQLNFRVRTDAPGCTSFSNVAGDLFVDNTPPSVPVLTSVQVDTLTGLSTLTWSSSPQPDTDGYIIVLVTSTGGVIIDTVYGQGTITYTWPLSTPGDGPESFAVAAFDTCYTGTPPSPNTSAAGAAHTTVHAYTQYDRCARRITLRWTPYGGWPVAAYEVYGQVDGGAWALLHTAGPAVTNWVHDVLPDRTYTYVVKALSATGALSSLSNKTVRVSDYPALPAYNYLRTVTVTANDLITVIDSADLSASVGGYRLERSDNGGPWVQAGFAPGWSGPVITFTDSEVDATRTGYRYRVVVVDSCGRDALTSNTGGNIVLRAEPDLTGTNRLTWNGYEQWAGSTVSHTVFRSIDNGSFTLLATLPPDPWTYTDNVQPYIASTGRFCYMVEAAEAGNPSGVNAISRSNTACAVQEELVYIPNAFVVGGANPEFLPVISYADVTDYELSIINRWGQVIWTSYDPAKGWNGMVSGSRVPIGVYAYYCAFNNGSGKRIERRGTVTMLTALD